jgi:hypothetical protein
MDYDALGHGYAARRRADPRIAARVHAALGSARTVVNVGAGAGSYEPADRWVLAVEPSATMRAQRPPSAAPALAASAERLPFDDGAFDAAMATITVHHWSDHVAGLRELRRVARGPVVVMTFAIQTPWVAWFGDYLPEGASLEGGAFPDPDEIAWVLGGARVEVVPVPLDCTDASSRASTGVRRRSSTRRSAPRSPCGRGCRRARRSGSWRGCRPTWRRVRGTRRGGTCARSPSWTAGCGSS